MQIIGQEKLLNNIDALIDKSALPQSILLVGDLGSGKHSIINYVSDKLQISVIDLSNNISDEIISDIYLSVTRNIYLLHFSNISIKNQNSLLKLIEEPPQNCIIIGICEDKSQVIPTIQNRCQIWTLEKYSKELLRFFTDNEYLLSVCNTPGKIITFQNLDGIDINYYKTLANTVIERIYNANVANILTISDKLSFKQEDNKEKLSADLFIGILKYTTLEKINSNIELSRQYDLIEKLYNDFMIPHINKKYLFDNFLLRLKYSIR